LQRVGSEPVDLVIADHLMPAMNGLDLLAHLAEHNPAVRRVLLTGCCGHTRSLHEGLAAARLHGYLEKPWDNAALERLLRQLLLPPALPGDEPGPRSASLGRAWPRTPTTATSTR
jgi:response regulator RpfG family c-di-GMP phosphodiesterase